MALYFCGATSDIGVGRELQEDFVQFCELDDNNLFCVIQMVQVPCHSDHSLQPLLLWIL